MLKIIQLFIISLIVSSCQADKSEVAETQPIDLSGSWEYLGFGKGIVIGDSIVESFHLSSAGNVRLSDNTTTDYFKYYTIDTLSQDTITLKDGVKLFKLFRTNEDFALNIKDSLADDPQYNFEVLWSTFNEQYAYFKERNIDWDKTYEEYASKVADDTSPLDLYLVFEEMLASMNDGHVSIELPDEIEDAYANRISAGDQEISDEVPQGLEAQVKDLITETYLDRVGKFSQGEIKWGMIDSHVAYLQIHNMISWAHYPIPDSLPKEQFWEEWWKYLNKADNYHDDVANGTSFMMDSIISDVAVAKALIIDLRFNGGGFDDASVEILNHLVKEPTDISAKKVRLGAGFTDKQVMTLTPSKRPFNGKLFVLTSPETASAAELLVLGSRVIPNAKVIGSTTEGVFSDILFKKLPNGWKYGLSNMIYESMDGISYEEVGLAPDIEIDYPVESAAFYKYLLLDLEDGDEAIEKVLEVVGAN